MDQLETLCGLIGERLTVVMGGSSGVLMSIFFTAAGQAIHDGKSIVSALQAGLAQMKFYGGADLGDRTLIDALQPALDALAQNPGNLDAAYRAAQAGADATSLATKANAGRASYLNSDSLAGNMDPGAHAVAMVFKALAGQ
ncbi:Dihydroxyacetone kinase [Kluyvera intermedia]|nr:Dihydroxyacetone kinase [Kluyvera intermedia]